MSETKAPHVERFQRSFQSLIYRFLTERQTMRYIDELPGLLSTYNKRGHRSLAYMTPEEAELPKNQGRVLIAVNDNYSKIVAKKQKPKFSVGETVRISKLRHKMLRGYQEQFKEEYFKIISVSKRLPIPMFGLQSLETGEMIDGNFYASELQRIGPDSVFKIREVIKTRGKGKSKQGLVRWAGYGDQFNSWEPFANISTPGAQMQ